MGFQSCQEKLGGSKWSGQIGVAQSDEDSLGSTKWSGQFRVGAHYWIGLIDLHEGNFRWSYDQENAKFTSWGSGEPGNNGGNEYCAGYAVTWYDAPCYNKYHWICERNFCKYCLILTLDGLKKELEKKEWKTYKDHCYYLGGDAETWFNAEATRSKTKRM
ncbi:unnamed protein product [Mytilus edulis]|uniref:C-type lectin domain-containing protein n=1 Tax=Mytilus edulis TaxID=6550 RepID=A0A8S3QIT6_MYTED|nr:unnamed protein product [Mytilus edulis]